MKRIGVLLKNKTVIGAIVAIFGPYVAKYTGIDESGLIELIQAIGSIFFVIGARDAIRKLEK